MPFIANAAASDVTAARHASWPRSLAPFLPSRTTRLFAQASLLETPQDALQCFNELLYAIDGDFVAFLSGAGKELRGHLPQLFGNLRSVSDNLPDGLTPYLKTATLRAKLRFEIFEKCLTETIGHLNSLGLPYVATKGVVASVTGYDTPFLRHCHDFDLVVSRSDQLDIAAHLEKLGYKPVAHPGSTLRMDHEVGLPVMLHSAPLEGPLSVEVEWMLDGRRVIGTVHGPISVPAPAKAVLHSCLHGQWAYQRTHQNWMWDASLMLRKFTPDDRAVLGRLVDGVEARLSLVWLRDTISPIAALDGINMMAPRSALVSPLAKAHYAANGHVDLQQGLSAIRSPGHRLGMLMQRIWPPDWYFGPRGAMQPAQLRQHRIKRLGQVMYWRGLMPIRRRF